MGETRDAWGHIREFLGTILLSTERKYRTKAEPDRKAASDTADTVDRVKDAVVQVRTRSGNGSGMVVADGRLILTNRHVVGAFPWVSVAWLDGAPRPARVVLADRRLDLAVLSVDSPGNVRLEMHEHEVRPGTRVIAIGYPFDLSSNVTQGIVSAVEKPSERAGGVKWLRTDAAINPGNSGGPLLTTEGLVVGMNTSGQRGAQGINYALPADYLHAAVRRVNSWNLEARLYCPPCGNSATGGRYCEVCGAKLQRHPIPGELIGGPRTIHEDRPRSAIRQSLERARAVITTSLQEFVTDLQPEIQIHAQQVNDCTWEIGTDFAIKGIIRVKLAILRDRLHLLLWSQMTELPLENISAFYRRLLSLNRPDVLGRSKICVGDDWVALCQIHPADSLEPGQVWGALRSLIEGAITFGEEMSDASAPEGGEEKPPAKETGGEDESVERLRQDEGLLGGLVARIGGALRRIRRRARDAWADNSLAVEIEGALRFIPGVSVSREKLVYSWRLNVDGSEFRVVLMGASNEDWSIQVTTPIMHYSPPNELAFERRLLEMNGLEAVEPSRFFIEENRTCLGAFQELEGLDRDKFGQLIKDFRATTSRVSKELREEFFSL